MKKSFLFVALLCLTMMTRAAVYDVSTYSQFVNAVYNGIAMDNESLTQTLTNDDVIRLTADITYDDANGVVAIPAKVTRTIDMNGHTLQRNVTNSSSAIRPTITMGRNSTLTLINGNIICNNTLVDNSVLPCGVYMPAEGATLNLKDMIVFGLVNTNDAPNAHGVILGEQANLTLNVDYANLRSIYDMNKTYDHTFNLYGCNLGSATRLQLSTPGLGWKVNNENKIKGRFINSEIYGTNMSAATFLSLVGDDGYEFQDIANGYSVMTRAQVQNADMSTAQIRVYPKLNFSVANTAVTPLNCNDILKDGRLSFDFLTNTLYLKKTAKEAETLNGDIYFQQQDGKLTINVDGKYWRINGQIEGYCGEIELQAAHRALTEEEGTCLSVIYAAETPIVVYGGDLSITNRLRLYVESDKTHDNAIKCSRIFINDSWLDAWGVKPVVQYSHSFLINAQIKNNNQLSNDIVAQVEPVFKKYIVWVFSNDKNAGTVSGDGHINEGTVHTVTATPKSGYHFLRWDNGVTENPYTFTVTEDVVLYASFEADVKINYFTINAVASDETMGIVRGGGQAEENTSITLSATPNSGYEFQYWTDTKGQRYSGATLTWTATQDETLTAHFRAIPDYNSYTMYINGTQITSNNQNDVLGDGVWAYDETTNTLTTMAKKTYTTTNQMFIENYRSMPLNIVLNHSITINASTTDFYKDVVIESPYGINFIGIPMRRLTISCTDMRALYAAFGEITVSDALQLNITQKITSWGESNITSKFLMQLKNTAGGLTVNGAELYLNITGSSNFKVSNITNDKLILNKASITSGAMDGTSLNIFNDAERYNLHYSNFAVADICPVYGFGFYYPGQVAVIRAEPAYGYTFTMWSDGNTDNPRVITMPEHNMLIDPMVEKDGIQPSGAIINFSAPEEQGYITGFTSGWFYADVPLSITAVANEGYEFVQWSDGQTMNPYTLTVEAGKDINIVAVFADKNSQGTGLDQTTNDKRLTTKKVIENGVLYIERNGKVYNAQGSEIR